MSEAATQLESLLAGTPSPANLIAPDASENTLPASSSSKPSGSHAENVLVASLPLRFAAAADRESGSLEPFSARHWVDDAFAQLSSNALRASERPSTALSGPSVVAIAKSLIVRLENLLVERNQAIQEASQRAVESIPRVLRELERLRREALALSTQIASFKEHLTRVETSTAESLRFVAEIDVIKMRMEKSCACLQESRLVLETAARLEQSLTAAESSSALFSPTNTTTAPSQSSRAGHASAAASSRHPTPYLPENISEVDAELLTAAQRCVDLALAVDTHQHQSGAPRRTGTPAVQQQQRDNPGAVSGAALERAVRVCEQVAAVRDGLRGAASMVPALSATSESLRELQRRAYRVVIPLLAQALAASQPDCVLRCRELLRLIERPDAYQRWYGWMRGAPLRRWWRTRALIKESSDLHRWIGEWYGQLLDCYAHEVSWLGLRGERAELSSESATFCAEDALEDGVTVLRAVLSATAAHHAVLLERLGLLELVEAHRHTVRFVDHGLPQALTERCAQHLDTLRRLALRPCLPYLLRYAQLEYRYLSSTVLETIKASFKRLDRHSAHFAAEQQRRRTGPHSSTSADAHSAGAAAAAGGDGDTDTKLLEVFEKDVRAIQESAAPLLLALEESVDRFVEFTRGTQTLSFLTCLSDILEEYMKHVTTQIRFLKAPLRERATKAAERKQRQRQQHASHLSSFYSSENGSQQDWTEFQGALTILGCTSVLHRALQAFEKHLRSRLIETGQVLFVPGSSHHKLLHQGQEFTLGCERDLDPQQTDLDPSTIGSLFRFLQKLPNELLPNVTRLVGEMTETAEEFAFSTMFDFVQQSLQPLPELPCWVSSENKTGTDSLIGASVPVFALAPSPYATHTKEHLLALPQQLEPFAANLVLLASQASDALRGTEADPTLSSSSMHAATPEAGDVDARGESATSDASSSDAVLGEADAEQFVYRWVGRVGEATLALFIEQIERIPRLSQAGVAQLIADVEYLSNVLAVLGVPLDERLSVILQTLRNPPSSPNTDSTPTSQLARSLSQKMMSS